MLNSKTPKTVSRVRRSRMSKSVSEYEVVSEVYGLLVSKIELKFYLQYYLPHWLPQFVHCVFRGCEVVFDFGEVILIFDLLNWIWFNETTIWIKNQGRPEMTFNWITLKTILKYEIQNFKTKLRLQCTLS